MNEPGNFHPIACESCRSKKSKCDRELPTCSQCTFSSVVCRYPPVNKRGIPSGYVSLVEQRLLETEIVVLELLSAVQRSGTSVEQHSLSDQERLSLANIAQKQSKSHKIEEWKNFPLGSERQRQIWWSKKREGLGMSRLPLGEMLGHKALDDVAFLPVNSESLQHAEKVASPAQLANQSQTFAVSPAPSVPQWTGIGRSESVEQTNVLASDARGLGIDGMVTPSLSSGTPGEMNPLVNLSGTVDKWRKYF